MNEIQSQITQTPIEIALGIDADGKTTAKKLYEFLEMRQGDYARWYKSNILENPFAIENEDYEVLRTNAENPKGGRPTQDFKLSANFAKKLSMQGKTEKAEQARDYFIKVEDRLKEIAAKGILRQFDWQETRQAAKENRLLETDSIKEFVAYAKRQGSQNADRYYYHLTKLANKAAGITEGRDKADIQQLNNLTLIEHIISEVLRDSMGQEKPYKEIYLDCRERIEQFKEVAYLGYLTKKMPSQSHNL